MKYNNKEMRDKLFSYTMSKFDLAKTKKDIFLSKADTYYKYYYQKLPLSMAPGSDGKTHTTKFIEPVAKSYIDTILPTLLYTFTDNRKAVVNFHTDDAQFAPVMKVLNKEMGNIILRDSDGAEVIQRAAKDACVTGVGVAHYGIEEDVTSFDIDLSGMPAYELMETLAAIEAQCTKEEYEDALNSVTEFEFEKYEEEDIVPEGITITYRTVKRKPYLVHIPVTDWFADPQAVNQEKMDYFCHISTSTVGDLMEQGYKRKDLSDADFVEELSNPIKLGAHEFDDKGDIVPVAEDELMKSITLYNHFIKTSLPLKGKRNGLFQVITTDSKVLTIKEVDFIPYLVGNVAVDSNSMYGDSFVRQVMSFQDRKSLVNEARIHKGLNNTYGRYIAVKGQFNKRALLDNVPGGIIEVESMGAVAPFAEMPLDNSLEADYQASGMTIDDMTMVSSGAKTDMTSQSNVSTYTAAISQYDNNIRSKVILRDWSRTFMEPLMQGMYNLLKMEGYKLPVTNPQGETVHIPFAQLPPSRALVDNTNTLFEELARKDTLNSLMTVAIQGQAFPTIQAIFTPEKLYGLVEEFLGTSDIDVAKVAQNVAELPPPSEEEQQSMMEAKAMEQAASKLLLEKAHLDNEKVAIELAHSKELFIEELKKTVTERVKYEFDMKMEGRRVDVLEKKVQLSEEKLDAEKVIQAATNEKVTLRSLGNDFN